MTITISDTAAWLFSLAAWLHLVNSGLGLAERLSLAKEKETYCTK